MSNNTNYNISALDSGTCDFKLIKADVVSQIGDSITMEIIVDKYIYDVQIQVQLLDDSGDMLVDYYTVDTLTGSSKIIYFDLPPDINVCKIKTRLYQLICFGDGSDSKECCTSECEDCATACAESISNPPWNLDDCIEANASVVYIASNVRVPSTLPEPALPTGKLIFPKTISMSLKQIPLDSEDLCSYGLDGSYTMEYSSAGSSPPSSLLWEISSTTTKVCSASLLWDGTMFTITINTEINNSVLKYKLYPPVRWREFYDDWIINPNNKLNSSTIGSNPITINGSYAEKLGFLDSIIEFVGPCSNYESNTECLYGSTSGSGSAPPNIEISLTMDNTCRIPEPCPTSGPCPAETNIGDYTQYDDCLCDKCYCDGGGRPIDIDILCGSSPLKTHPQEPDFPLGTESYTLWFVPRGDRAVPVINNILYDTGLAPTDNSIIIKVHTAKTPLEMREWVCKNLRFVTISDRTKLSTDLNNAVESNWPYNDLYWDYKCDTYASDHPNDIPINLVPC